MGFYDDIAADYDEMTAASARTAKAEGFLKSFLERYPIRSALDVACGTGIYTIPLARMGVEASGADLSEEMLQQARRRARQAGAAVHWILAPMQNLAERGARPVDAIFCMGNSIPHLLEDAALTAALQGFYRLLNPGGVLVLQLLNYARVLARQERIVSIDRSAVSCEVASRGTIQREYVRFYDFLPGLVRFNILQITWTGDNAEPLTKLHSTTLRPYSAGELTAALGRSGFRDVQPFSGLNFAPFIEADSDTVMLVARK